MTLSLFLSSHRYISTLEWILIYSTVPVTFHVITNTDSVEYVQKIFDKVNEVRYSRDMYIDLVERWT